MGVPKQVVLKGYRPLQSSKQSDSRGTITLLLPLMVYLNMYLNLAAAHCILWKCFSSRQVATGSAQISKKKLMGNEAQNTQNYLMLHFLATYL